MNGQHPASPSRVRVLFSLLAGFQMSLLLMSPAAWGQLYEDAELLPSGLVAEDFYGKSVSVFGDVAVIGAIGDDDHASESGAAYVFRYDPGAEAWDEEIKLTPPGGETADWFGYSVAICGDVAVISAKYDDDNGISAGAVYVFRYAPGSGDWDQEAKLLASDGAPNALFGQSVAISEDLIIVGAHYANGNELWSGAAYVFRYDPVAKGWTEEAKLTALDGEYDACFGISTDIAGSLAVIGACWGLDSDPAPGAAYVFRYDDGAGTWTQEAKLLAADGAAGDRFGFDVALSDQAVVIGAYGDAESGPGPGAAYVFRFDPGVPEWSEETKLLAADGYEGDAFGYSVAISGDLALIGSVWHSHGCTHCGSAYLYAYDSVSGEWDEISELLASDGDTGDYFGGAVSLDGSRAVVGAQYADHGGENSGAAYAHDCGKVLDAGVCCGDDFCQIVTENECTSLGGDWHPEYESCDPDPCLQRVCCVDGDCVVASELECISLGGDLHPEYDSCDPPNPCLTWSTAHDWDFTISDHGFATVYCDVDGEQIWEYGRPDEEFEYDDNVWGTILEGGYPNEAGEGLLSPTFPVEAGDLLRVSHWYDTESMYDGGNVTVDGEVIFPLGGHYSPQRINLSYTTYAWCVDSEKGWHGHSGRRVDYFDLSVFVGQEIAVEFDFGSDTNTRNWGWYLTAVRVLRVQTSSAAEPDRLPLDLVTLQVQPNPAASQMDISFDLPAESFVRADVFDVSGRHIRTLIRGTRSHGHHSLTWDLEDQDRHRVSGGIYWMSFEVGTTQVQRRLVVLE